MLSGVSRPCLKQSGGRSGIQLGVGAVRGCCGGSAACRVCKTALDEEEDEEEVGAAGQTVESGASPEGRWEVAASGVCAELVECMPPRSRPEKHMVRRWCRESMCGDGKGCP